MSDSDRILELECKISELEHRLSVHRELRRNTERIDGDEFDDTGLQQLIMLAKTATPGPYTHVDTSGHAQPMIGVIKAPHVQGGEVTVIRGLHGTVGEYNSEVSNAAFWSALWPQRVIRMAEELLRLRKLKDGPPVSQPLPVAWTMRSNREYTGRAWEWGQDRPAGDGWQPLFAAPGVCEFIRGSILPRKIIAACPNCGEHLELDDGVSGRCKCGLWLRAEVESSADRAISS